MKRRINRLRRWLWHVPCGYLLFAPIAMLHVFRHVYNAVWRVIDPA